MAIVRHLDGLVDEEELVARLGRLGDGPERVRRAEGERDERDEGVAHMHR